MVRKGFAAVGVALMLHGFAQAANSAAAQTAQAVEAAEAHAAAAVTLAEATQAESAPGDDAGSRSPEAPAGTWAAQGQLGLLVTSANTTTKSGNATFDAAHLMGPWTLSGGFAALYASTGHYSTQQDTNVHLQADLTLSKRTFWFSTARWDRNLFTGFAYQESVATGAGFKFMDTPATLLAGELGVGYRRERAELLTLGPVGNVTVRGCSSNTSGTIDCLPQPVVSDALLQAGLNYSHSITQSTKLVNTLLVQYGSSDTTTTDNLALQVKVDASLALAVGVQLVNNTSPPPGAEKHTDTVVTVNLVYALKNPKLSPTSGTPTTVSGFNLP